MGVTYDEVSSVDRSAEYGLSGSGTVGRDGSAHARCWVLRDRVLLLLFGVGVVADSLGPFFVSPWWGCVEGYRPYFENYTVDASILKTHVCVFLK